MTTWWEKGGREKFAGLCEVADAKEADYILAWAENVEAINYSYTVRRTESSDVWLDTRAHDWSTGRTTNANTYGTITTTRPETRTGTRKEWHVLMEVWAVEKRGSRQASTLLYQTQHTGRWIWSKPDKECIVDAMSFLRDSTK
jgi:hypothetical protein